MRARPFISVYEKKFQMSAHPNLSHVDWRRALLTEDSRIQEAVQNLNDTALGIVLVVDGEDKLLGSITDGDIRRGLLRGLSMENPIQGIIRKNPLVVPHGLTSDTIRQIMTANKILQIPEVDEDFRVINLHTWRESERSEHIDSVMVVMAGGKGTRLRPYTEECPKPMLEVQGKPMLLHIIERAKSDGFGHFVLAVNYLRNMIEDYFEDGAKFGVRIEYLREEAPLGTAGALSLLPQKPEKPFIVTNGDVITDVRYSDLLNFHIHNKADATMAVGTFEWQHPFGVVSLSGLEITDFKEKPIITSYINSGVYALSPDAIDYLVKTESCDMPTLFKRMRDSHLRTYAYPIHEYWLDVGRPKDLEMINGMSQRNNDPQS
jgi:dTDP-glucose pyrophosphorylase